MSEPHWEKIKGLFAKASALAGRERDEFLDRECGEGPLRSFVESLLASPANDEKGAGAPPRIEDRDGGLIAANGTTTAYAPLTEKAGSRIGPYKLLQQIGEGGFGVVFMADQEKPVRRRVALKIIKLGMDTRRVVARFEAERQALAMMDHPNIAKVLDAGATESGRPYFVMELVRGVPITEYCDANNLTAVERLELFMPVCRAIQHAHTKSVIHRDIKPSNILVTLHDGKPVPKVIDFGIAKATDHHLTEKTLFTELRQLIGTPAYMSPEQAEMSGLDIDTRTDVYSLGVLLYELLTGTTPFPAEDLLKAGYGEMQRIIRETEPPRPSTRVSSLASPPVPGAPPSEPGTQVPVADATTPNAPPTGAGGSDRGRSTFPSAAYVASRRRTEPRKLGLLLRGDLDWIVMKSLEKDRTRRYETAEAFAADVQRHLSGEPVVAAPPSAAYRVKKFFRKHRAGALIGSLIVTTIVIGVSVAMWGLRSASAANKQLMETNARLSNALTEIKIAGAKRRLDEIKTESEARQLNNADVDIVYQCVLIFRDGGGLANAEYVEASDFLCDCLHNHGFWDPSPSEQGTKEESIKCRRQVLDEWRSNGQTSSGSIITVMSKLMVQLLCDDQVDEAGKVLDLLVRTSNEIKTVKEMQKITFCKPSPFEYVGSTVTGSDMAIFDKEIAALVAIQKKGVHPWWARWRASTVWSQLIDPSKSSDVPKLLRTARKAADWGQGDDLVQRTLALALYRSGNYANVIQVTDKLLDPDTDAGSTPQPAALALAAMSRYRLGRHVDAVGFLNRLRKLVVETNECGCECQCDNCECDDGDCECEFGCGCDDCECEYVDDEDASTLLEEAESLIEKEEFSATQPVLSPPAAQPATSQPTAKSPASQPAFEPARQLSNPKPGAAVPHQNATTRPNDVP